MSVIPACLKASPEVMELLSSATDVTYITSEQQLLDMVMGGQKDVFEVAYDVPGKGRLVEAKVTRVKEGFAVWFPPKIRQRAPNALVVAEDGQPSDHPRLNEKFGLEYIDYQTKVCEWLKGQPLIVVALFVGPDRGGVPVLAVIPKNAAFFAFGMGLLQSLVPLGEGDAEFVPKGQLLLAPSMRHELFDEEQVVVHHRGDTYTIISDNLYPGPSGKKGAGYAMLVHFLQLVGGVAAHCSVVTITLRDGTVIVWMHGGPSGAAKSENGRKAPLDAFGNFVLGQHLQSGRTLTFHFDDELKLKHEIDDIGIVHPDAQTQPGLVVVQDGERKGWFLRVEGICSPEDEPEMQQMVAETDTPLLFLNIDGEPGQPIKLYEHTDGCTNPRWFGPRRFFHASPDELAVNVQSWGFRQPPCTADRPTYGIGGLCHVLPWQVAWLWYLLSPRGDKNPSIIGENGKMASEGVGSYKAFSPGREVDQANLLLKMMQRANGVQHLLVPNQHIGPWSVGYGSMWFVREWLSRKPGGPCFATDELVPSPYPLFGYALRRAELKGQEVESRILRPWEEYGRNAYQKGRTEFVAFAHPILQRFALDPDIDPIGRDILNWAIRGGRLEQFGHPGPKKQVA